MALTQQELESRLLAAANSLRGPVDPADFKQYVFPLLFLKRLSDNWDAVQGEAEADYAPVPVPKAAYKDYHRFDIPTGCHWSDLRKVTENVGYALQVILDRIQEANPTTLAGIFGEVAWANKDRLPEHALSRLIDIFNGIPLAPDVVTHDMLGHAYEYLLREFAEASGKKAGEFFTPRAVVRLLTRLLDPRPGESIYDPAAGSAGMLVEAVNEVKESGGDIRTLRLYGQEVNLTTAAIARMNLYMHDIEDFKIMRGDTLREPKFTTGGGLTTFEVVLANPPFSLKNWGSESWSTDPYKRGFCGVPPSNTADFAWVQHMLASMKSGSGRVGVVMPLGVLFRGGQEADIRKCLIQSGMLRAVVALPPNLFYSTSIPACLMIFNAVPSPDTDGILLIDATRRFVKARPMNRMTDADVDAVVRTYASRTEQDGVRCAVASAADIKEQAWDLNIPRYLPGVAAETLDVATAIAEYLDASAELGAAEAALQERLQGLGLV